MQKKLLIDIRTLGNAPAESRRLGMGQSFSPFMSNGLHGRFPAQQTACRFN